MSSQIDQAIAANVRRIRIEKNLTQEDLAERSGVSRNTIAILETKTTYSLSAETLESLAKGLGVDITELFSPIYNENLKEVDETLEQFLKSGLIPDITKEEEEELKQARWPWGPPTIGAWHYALLAMRATKQKGELK